MYSPADFVEVSEAAEEIPSLIMKGIQAAHSTLVL
jgi:hypothetical protein